MSNLSSSHTLYTRVGGCLQCPLVMQCARQGNRLHTELEDCPPQDQIMKWVCEIYGSDSPPNASTLLNLSLVTQWLSEH
jgi:hypothetical protein